MDANSGAVVPEALPRFLAARTALAGLGPARGWARRLNALARFRLGRPHDPDFAAFGVLSGDGLFLDVGASAGQSAYSFRLYRPSAPILALEPLPQHRADLAFVRRVLEGFDFRIEAAAERSGQATLYVPTWGGWEMPAYSCMDAGDARARLARFVAGGADARRLGLREIPVTRQRIDDLELAPAFVKIDVEGAEFGVLKGMSETLAASRPVLMIEKTAQAGEWSDWLIRAFDYRACVFNRAARGFDNWHGQQALNLFFLPG